MIFLVEQTNHWGKKNISQKTVIIYRNYKKINKKFYNLINYIKKIEKIFGIDYLDIELIKKKNLYFSSKTNYQKNKNSDKTIDSILVNLRKKLENFKNIPV